ncbi:Nucleosomal histone H3-Lys79 methylase [Puccinia graminis f. sp. tritici]|uniref:Histone-lysine N-methyltransferase, H3 lysine-79 specific n=1 Tax=Puccinia graminis f. sp. tritici TaxID=56615 RepID=A0A5B0RIZ2_PUCGR|nr:Nucleosomal histone H3-Lys79 methylase [Puccinia graminis f. sp. tritici]
MPARRWARRRSETAKKGERSSPEPGRSTTPKIPLSDASLDLSSKPLLKELAKTIRRKNGDRPTDRLGYETWSSNVYGELKPRFVSEIIRLVGLRPGIIRLVGLRPGMVFLDLGSGIGNIVLQVALEVGCVAVGFEIMDGCTKLANLQRSELVGRAHSLWGVNLGAPRCRTSEQPSLHP